MSRRRTGPARVISLAVAAALAAALPARAIEVLLTSPRPFAPVFGEVVIEAEVLSVEPVAQVVLLVDDRVVARLTEPPWRAVVDVGEDNVAHTFDAVATVASGATASDRVATRAIAVDLELDLKLRQLYVTVARGRTRVLDLPRAAFTVLDEGQRHELVTFEQGDVPLTVALLVDTSSSMAGPRLRAALEGAESFVSLMQPLDEVSLALFSDRLLYQTPFTGKRTVVARGLDGVESEGGTAINDHLYAALERLDRRQGRRVVILLSDGDDVESALSIEEVRWKARRSQALVYWIHLREGAPAAVAARSSAWRDAVSHDAERAGLARLVGETGGRIVELARIEDAPAAFRDVLAELREQYVLGYYPSAALGDGRWRRVQVRVDSAGSSVRARAGYVDD